MRVRVVFLGILKELAGSSEGPIELQTGATVGDLWSALQSQTPELARFGRSVAVAVNQCYSTSDTLLNEDDEVALLPPVSGGSGAPPQQAKSRIAGDPNPLQKTMSVKPCLKSAHCRLQYEPVDSECLLHRMRQGEDGAVVAFDGIVRNNSHGRRTLYLEYEAYEKMALDALEALAAEAKSRFEVRECAIIHRLGRLEIGETSVLIVVASTHRAAAFDACRWIIDTLKRVVPIWKKEHFADGAVWADGDSFPSDVATLNAEPPEAAQGSGGSEAKNSANS